ncbi:AzlD domain-containing protein [Knoellia sp. p5-6-4]|uniref:AzlD domain-containing protein n=1 Tax=unclassified Knoellia TaxID=2618719 RepID=UPI0023DC9399|nr:AzlD domain-containing protein [Knoellia sp. p5-6-4]MDF2146130.1 AzlD domain-containing protein [Knoellia sp. p5-6-4]
MTMWTAVLTASALAFALKFLGYVVPAGWLEGPRTSRVTSALPIALLSALVAVQTLTGEGGGLVVDARLAAVLVAMAALALRAPFLLVVTLAAVTAALLRAAGWG